MSRIIGRTFGELGAILGILSEVVRLFHSFLRCQGHRGQGGVYNGAFGDTCSTLMNTRSGGLRRRLVKLGWESKGMVILGEVLVVGGSALVVTSAIFWVWSLMKQRLLRGPDENSNRRTAYALHQRGDASCPSRGSARSDDRTGAGDGLLSCC